MSPSVVPRGLGPLALALLPLSACNKEQSFAEGMRIVCDAPNQVAGRSLAGKATGLATYIDAKVTNQEVRTFVRTMAASEPAAKPRKLDEARQRAKLDGCPLADLWAMPPTAPLAPAPDPEAEPLNTTPSEAIPAANEPPPATE